MLLRENLHPPNSPRRIFIPVQFTVHEYCSSFLVVLITNDYIFFHHRFCMPYTPLQDLKTDGLTEMFGEFNFDDLDSDDEVPERNDRRSATWLRCLFRLYRL